MIMIIYTREPDPMVAGRLSIGDYKRPLPKCLVNCPYLFVQKIDKFCRLLIGVEVVHRGDDSPNICNMACLMIG